MMALAIGLFLLIATLIAVSGCTSVSAYSPFEGDTYRHNDGGQVRTFGLKLEEYERTGRAVRLMGHCNSACTLFLALPPRQVCQTPGTTYLFHKSWGGTYEDRQITDDYMWSVYPYWVKTWLSSNGWDQWDSIMPYNYSKNFVRDC
jgi:hypothetical protein